ncbi:MAG TPA: hydantoinase/oxoprolinase family protein [Candidatus Dormibacteraeota bacterium]|nr:hydantoinase/oxoprolinase family protein [Candidatus Dormibacteraeota bacterium]
MNSIDIDVGGTFTDLVLNFDGKALIKKTPTTPYDLSVCFSRVIEEGAGALGLKIDQLLPAIDMIRYSTTIAMNRLIEKKGPRLGLITTEGHEDVVLIGRGAQWIDGTRVQERRNLAIQKKPEPLIPRDMIVGVKERVDSRGTIIRPLDENDVREKVRYLVSRGARGFVVSLLWGFLNSAHERRVKEIIRDEYKEFHIGYLPVVLAGQVVGKLGEYERTLAAILDAYLQRSMQIELSAMWDKLRERGYTKPLLMIQSSGGIAEVFRTTACRTFNSGPVSGLMGAHHVAKSLGYQNVVMTDMGGTSFDVGLVVKDSVRSYDFRPIIDRWMVGITMIKTLSVGAGGGSIASINPLLQNQLQVGPRSAGSMPGPACFSLGGTEPTVTDADVVLGYINPGYYSGGRMKLDKNRAIAAVRDKIAKPFGISVEEAAMLIRKIVNGNMASAIMKEVHLRGYSPEDFILFVGGGAGATHAEGYKADIKKAVTFPFSPVFCAFGSSTMDIMHVYEVSKKLTLMSPGTQELTQEFAVFNRTVEELLEQARKDLMADGLNPSTASFVLELDMLYGGQFHVKRALSPRLALHSTGDVAAICEAFKKEFSEAFSPFVVNPEGGVFVDSFILKAIVPVQQIDLPKMPLEGHDPSGARKGERPAYWADAKDFRPTPIYAYEMLKPGNRLEGPAILEGEYTTVVVPPAMKFSIDERGLGILES